MNILKKLTPAILTLAMLLGMVAATITPASAAATVPGCVQWHVVKQGEYLTQIAKLYNTTWKVLVEINDLQDPNIIYAGQNLCVSVDGTTTTTNDLPNTSSGIRIYATNVKEDLSVTLQGKYLVANTTYTLYLSNFKAKQPIDYLLGSVKTDKDGAFKVTYNLPSKLYDVSKIKVILTNGKGDTASNWFYNLTSDGNVGGMSAPALSLTIVSVDEGNSVKIQASNLLPNITYQVYMDKTGKMAVNGILVGTLSSTKGGTVTATFEIPDELTGRSKIDIRVENNTFEAAAYQTFKND